MKIRDARTILTAALCLLWGFTPASVAAPRGGLVAHYRLASDARDSSGGGNHGIAHGVTFDAKLGATFDGIDDYIEVPHAKSLDLSTDEVSPNVIGGVRIEVEDPSHIRPGLVRVRGADREHLDRLEHDTHAKAHIVFEAHPITEIHLHHVDVQGGTQR